MVLELRNRPPEIRFRPLNLHSVKYRRAASIFVWVLFNQPSHPCKPILQLSHNSHPWSFPKVISATQQTELPEGLFFGPDSTILQCSLSTCDDIC